MEIGSGIKKIGKKRGKRETLEFRGEGVKLRAHRDVGWERRLERRK
jgi:hypothetical protein